MILPQGWHPIANETDLPLRHVYHAQLLGQELAVWRADDGHINIWENRCLHRGVRLSIGINDGQELKCQYHGWRYANRTAGCTYIPAHPADAPARTISNRVYPMRQALGLVWTRVTGEADSPDVPAQPGAFALRPLPVTAPPSLVAFQAAAEWKVAIGEEQLSFAFEVGWLFVQPVDSGRSVLRVVLQATPAEADRIAVLRQWNTRLSALRDRCETRAKALPEPAPLQPSYMPVSDELARLPEADPRHRGSSRVSVIRKWLVGTDVMAFELAPLRGQLPTFQPGAHIDLHLPNGLTRQYSLINGPGQTAQWTIGVKREATSRGGSAFLHDTLREGDVLAVSAPRNNFPLRQDATHSLLIAGGIGLTPLLAMARTLDHRGLPYELHCFAASPGHLAFAEELAALGHVEPHLGLDPDQTAANLRQLLDDYRNGRHVYICGPAPMLKHARKLAAQAGWPDDAVHFEYFQNATPVDDSTSFEISLARSALTLTVPSGRSILEVLRDAGVDLPSSCEQGACGTCKVLVLEGAPMHQDVYLNDTEKRSNTCMMACVSRARSPRLVLDI